MIEVAFEENGFGPSSGSCNNSMKCYQKRADTNSNNDIYCAKILLRWPSLAWIRRRVRADTVHVHQRIPAVKKRAKNGQPRIQAITAWEDRNVLMFPVAEAVWDGMNNAGGNEILRHSK